MEVAKAALEEDVEVIALSFYSSGLMFDTTRLMELLKKEGLKDGLKVVVGGTIGEQERTELLAMGVDNVFMPGMGNLLDVVACINS